MKRLCLPICLFLTATTVACGGGSQAELERLRRENEALRARAAREQPRAELSAATLAHFSNDPALGTLAGLRPGDGLAVARERFGPEKLTRTWSSEGFPITQYEWDLGHGVLVRANADPTGRLLRIAVVLAGPDAVSIPTLYGLTLGRETYTSVQRRFGPALETDLANWGARDIYTVAQRVTFAESSRRLEFLYQMPAGLKPAELETIGNEVQQKRNLAVLGPHLAERAPFSIAIEEIK